MADWIEADSKFVAVDSRLTGWEEAATRIADIEPGITSDWVEVVTKTARVDSGLEGGWILAVTKTAIIKPPTVPSRCSTDADCAAGYECVDGKCVKKKVEGEVPWAWIAAGAVGIGGIVLLTGGKKPVGKKKT